jgi:hypothetical protein
MVAQGDVVATLVHGEGTHWINRDDLGMMRQLGVVPTPG